MFTVYQTSGNQLLINVVNYALYYEAQKKNI